MLNNVNMQNKSKLLEYYFSPDHCEYDDFYKVVNKNAYPFIVDDDGTLYIGHASEYHFDFVTCLFRQIKPNFYQENYSIYEWMDNHLCGRIWVTPNKPYSCIISVWDFADEVKNIYKELCQRLDVDYTKALLGVDEQVVQLYDSNEEIPQTSEDMKLARQIHLATQEEKRDFFKQFRKNRDTAQAEHNREEGWGNASQAEVNFWRNKGLDEAINKIISESINHFINKHTKKK